MDIERTETGKIDFFSGKSMDTVDEYVCDSCLNKFRVYAKVSFKTESMKYDDINKMHTTSLFDDKIALSEEGFNCDTNLGE